MAVPPLTFGALPYGDEDDADDEDYVEDDSVIHRHRHRHCLFVVHSSIVVSSSLFTV
jgi:hypothetical protein